MRLIERFLVIIFVLLCTASCAKRQPLPRQNPFIDLKQCIDAPTQCLNVIPLKNRDLSITSAPSNPKAKLVSFSSLLDFTWLNQQSIQQQLSANEKRRLIQQLSIYLNQESVNNYLKNFYSEQQQVVFEIEYVAVNNSAFFYPTQNNNSKAAPTIPVSRNADVNNANKKVIALIDSGVSTFNQSMKALNLQQWNPQQNHYQRLDTGLGHGTGVLSLTNQLLDAEGLSASYLSCNGLPYGQYDFSLILRCMNWFFLQPRVDLMLNPWLASQPGCLIEWQYPLQMLWLANTIPVFSAGNYGEQAQQSFSPANLSPFGQSTPLISVAAIDSQDQLLPSSSRGLNPCDLKRAQATLVGLGERFRVASPIAADAFQTVSGTSFAIVPVAVDIFWLWAQNPQASSHQIVQSLFSSSTDLGENGPDPLFGYGKINRTAANQWLKQNLN